MMTLALMLQFVPTIPADPAAAPDPATVVSAIMDQVALAAAPQIHTAGFGLWRGLAAILVVWTGLRVAFTGDFRPWDVVRVVIALWFPWAMLTFYNSPLPGSTRSFTAAITDGGEWPHPQSTTRRLSHFQSFLIHGPRAKFPPLSPLYRRG